MHGITLSSPVASGLLGTVAPNGDGWRQVGELGLALLLSAIIGFERELRLKSAGLRTHVLVGVGAALFHADQQVRVLRRVGPEPASCSILPESLPRLSVEWAFWGPGSSLCDEILFTG